MKGANTPFAAGRLMSSLRAINSHHKLSDIRDVYWVGVDREYGERTSLHAEVTGRGAPVGESGAARDRAERHPHRPGEGASVPPSQPPGTRNPGPYSGIAPRMTSEVQLAASSRVSADR